MGRQRYETQRDLEIELEIATAWAERFKLGLRKLPDGPRYSLDFAFLSITGSVICLGEVKDRPDWKYSYGTVMLGLSKFRELSSYERTGMPTYFIPRLAGEIVSCRIKDVDPKIQWTGRADRKDKEDKEPCVMIPRTLFRSLQQ